MKIGIDLDGVVFDSEKDFRIYAELYDIYDLKRNSTVDRKALRFQERFDWTEEEGKAFLDRYHEKIVRESNYMPGPDAGRKEKGSRGRAGECNSERKELWDDE